jgi:hypothetical protein
MERQYLLDGGANGVGELKSDSGLRFLLAAFDF